MTAFGDENRLIPFAAAGQPVTDDPFAASNFRGNPVRVDPDEDMKTISEMDKKETSFFYHDDPTSVEMIANLH